MYQLSRRISLPTEVAGSNGKSSKLKRMLLMSKDPEIWVLR